MKNFRNILFIFTLSLLIALVGCKKESTTTTTTDPTAQATAMQNNYKAATVNDALLVSFHQRTGSGSHDSCYFYWHEFNQYDSLFSYYFYDYCRNIYANHGGQNYSNEGWNWNMGGGNWNMGNWQCGLDTLQFQNWHGFGDCWSHDSTMYHKMQEYNMTGYFSSQASQCYNNMQSMRYNHYQHHNYHW
jgi:hypothetical protein